MSFDRKVLPGTHYIRLQLPCHDHLQKHRLFARCFLYLLTDYESTVASLFSMVPIYSCCSSPVRFGSFNRPAKPRIPFIGVRISWLILAKKADFRRSLSSACSLAIFNSSLICFTHIYQTSRNFNRGMQSARRYISDTGIPHQEPEQQAY
jgi:hypothetical protein